MPKDFKRQDLRGGNFKNRKDLCDANFSRADIRGAKFTGADLVKARFIEAQAGVQKGWMALQVFISFVLCYLLDFVGILLAVVFTAFPLNPNFPQNTSVLQYIEMLLIQAVIYFPLAWRGFTAKARNLIAIGVVFVLAGASAVAIHIAGASAVGVVGSALVAGVVAVAFAGALALALALALAVAGALAGVLAFALAFALALAGAGAFTGALASAIAGTGADAHALARALVHARAHALVIALAALLLSLYIAWQSSKEDEKFEPAHSLGLWLGMLGGTSFKTAETNLSDADFSRATLNNCDFSHALVTRTRFTDAKGLKRASLEGTILGDKAVRDLLVTGQGQQNYRGKNLQGANLAEAKLGGVDFTEADLSGAVLRKADLTGAILAATNLIGAVLDGATLTDAHLWETQRTGWSIQGVICEAVYWDEAKKERTLYAPGEFERLYADKAKIVLRYEGGINPVEITTLPALIQRLEAAYQGCALRLSSIEEAPGGAAKVTLVVEDFGGRTPAELTELTAALQEQAKQLQAAQRYALEQTDQRRRAERKLTQLMVDLFPMLAAQVRQLHVPPQERYLTVLSLDMRGFSGLEEEDRKTKVALLRGLALPLLDRHGGQYTNTWGDAIVACFDEANAGLTCACQLVMVLQGVGIRTRIGMSHGKMVVCHNPVIKRLDIEGEAVNFAARLEPLAEPGEVLISEELRYHPEIDSALFSFTRQSRQLKKSVGDQPQGSMIECYTTKLMK
jgi:uncharacterized protein YjbI with pentapeptide repeats/class 3 adenylate cyclase